MKDKKENNETGNVESMIDKNAFTVPDGYFDRLREDIKSSAGTGRGRIYRLPSMFPQVAVAAILLLSVISVSWYLLSQRKQETDKVTTAFTYDDLMNSSLLLDYDDDVLYEHYISLQSEPEETSSQKPATTEVNDYLIENEIDLNLIINEL